MRTNFSNFFFFILASLALSPPKIPNNKKQHKF